MLAVALFGTLLGWHAHRHQPAPSDTVDYTGTVSTSTDGQLIYSNSTLGLSFTFPQDWHLGSNILGYGTLQLFNYNEQVAEPKDTFPPDSRTNKIEAVITSDTSFTNNEYPERARDAMQMVINGQELTRQDVEFAYGGKVRAYFIPVPFKPGKVLSMVIFGDPGNFYVLDNIVKGLRWSVPSES